MRSDSIRAIRVEMNGPIGRFAPARLGVARQPPGSAHKSHLARRANIDHLSVIQPRLAPSISVIINFSSYFVLDISKRNGGLFQIFDHLALQNTSYFY